MKKRLSIFILILSMFLCLAVPGDTVWAAKGKTSVSVSSGSANIGDTITVTAKASGPSGEKTVSTMTLSYDSSILQFAGCSVTYGGGGSSVTATSDSFTVTLKAVAAGNTSISLSGSDGVVFDTNEELESMSGSSTSVKVNNAAGGGGSGGTDGSANGGSNSGDAANSGNDSNENGSGNEADQTALLSADNSLKTLTISPGSLSPAFTGGNTKYSATVANDVTSVAVSAVPVNEKASVESVTGHESLAVGSNTVSIVVKAENGVTATYKINVTRQAADANAAEKPEEKEDIPEEPEEPESEETEDTVTFNNVAYRISEDFTAEEVPADFTETVVNYHGTEHKGLSFAKGALSLLYLVPSEGEEAKGQFFIYEEARDSLYPFVKLLHGEKYVIVLSDPADFTMPDTYQQTTVLADEANSIITWQKIPEEGAVSLFSLFYGMNQDGTAGWYQFDALEGTYQRLGSEPLPEEEAESAPASDLEYLQKEYDALSDQYTKEKSFARNMIAVLVFIAAVLLIIIINLLLRRHGKNNGSGFDDDDDSEDDFSDRNRFPDEDDLIEEELPKEHGFSEEESRGRKKKRKSFFRRTIEEDLEDEVWEDEPQEEHGSEEELEETKRRKAREAFFSEESETKKATERKPRKKKKFQDAFDADWDEDLSEDYESDFEDDFEEEPVISDKKAERDKLEKDEDDIEIMDLNDL